MTSDNGVRERDKRKTDSEYWRIVAGDMTQQRDEALGRVAELWQALSDMSKAHDAMQDQVKTLRDALLVTAEHACLRPREADVISRALAATEPMKPLDADIAKLIADNVESLYVSTTEPKDCGCSESEQQCCRKNKAADIAVHPQCKLEPKEKPNAA